MQASEVLLLLSWFYKRLMVPAFFKLTYHIPFVFRNSSINYKLKYSYEMPIYCYELDVILGDLRKRLKISRMKWFYQGRYMAISVNN